MGYYLDKETTQKKHYLIGYTDSNFVKDIDFKKIYFKIHVYLPKRDKES